ncbi:MAG: L,D-transpeptidase [Jatrophihabitans sp.]
MGVSSVEGDGATVGIGMPLIVNFTVSPTSRSAFEQAAVVTVNGKPAGGAWFWERVYAGQPVQAHYRTRLYWPAHSKIHVALPVKGVSAGKGLTFANDLTLDYNIGASHISRIDASSLTMRVYSDGKLMKTFPVSLGAAKTPTFSGTKVVMEKHNPQRMIGPGYNELVPYSVRITLDGEFIHDAYWNTNIGRISTSNGCTNLTKDDSIWFYNFAQVGDVAEYPNAPGKLMPAWDGYGDWNVSWPTWSAGGAVGK